MPREGQAWGLVLTAGTAVLAALVAALWVGAREARPRAKQHGDHDTHASTTVIVEAISVPGAAHPSPPQPAPAPPQSP